MINISTFIHRELVITDLKAADKEEACRMLIDHAFETAFCQSGPVTREEALAALIKREKMQTTGLGHNLAFPHARIPGWKEFLLVIGLSKAGIDFKSLDGLPVHFICLMISSPDEPYIILQAMAALSRFVRETGNLPSLFQKRDPDDIARALTNYDVHATSVIHARDIMRPVKASVHLETPIQDVACTMHLHHVDVLPVVDKNNKLCGEISCFDIFAYGMPDFFNQLHTVSFVRHIDPFEKYFAFKKNLTVKDILKDHYMSISQEATLVEIIFQVTVKNRAKLFVIDEGSLVGEIDRFSIIDKILFF